MFSNDRNQMRQYFFDTWQKAQDSNAKLEPLELLIASIIQDHPEYHATINNPFKHLEKDYLPESGESNPFLHMGMHISLQEQVQTNRPKGITAIYQKLCKGSPDVHNTEHTMIECLAKSLHDAQVNQTQPDEKSYIKCLKKLLKK
ncbi:MAG: DUF1841 family protein [Methylococcales bacterium]|jgi:hypothetical protein|nr:DUF1841 family protein [Methylococcales bacterium]MBT7445180.1 DUF1841 family protein [Methylococcales bacterium]